VRVLAGAFLLILLLAAVPLSTGSLMGIVLVAVSASFLSLLGLLENLGDLTIAIDGVWRMKRGLPARWSGMDFGVGPDVWVSPMPATGPYRASGRVEHEARGSPWLATKLLLLSACSHALFIATFVGVFVALCTRGCMCTGGCPSGVSLARTACNSIRSQTLIWKQHHPSDPCPTLDELRSERLLDRGFLEKDPFGNRYHLLCDEDEVVCWTAGPDHKTGTEDDIVVPPPDPRH
jgi:hypothetical protein